MVVVVDFCFFCGCVDWFIVEGGGCFFVFFGGGDVVEYFKGLCGGYWMVYGVVCFICE